MFRFLIVFMISLVIAPQLIYAENKIKSASLKEQDSLEQPLRKSDEASVDVPLFVQERELPKQASFPVEVLPVVVKKEALVQKEAAVLPLDQALGALFADYVTSDGRVHYQTLAKSRPDLLKVLRALSTYSLEVYEKLSTEGQIAFWINAYNAITLDVIIQHYPIKRSGLQGFIFPENSIRQIPGAWTGLKYSVMGRDLTLEAIEHEILRKDFTEPGIHMALVCAAKGCPPLRNEPYDGDHLTEQLKNQAQLFLSNPEKFRIEKRQVFVSSIFKWFGADFQEKYENLGPKQFEPTERAIIGFIASHLDQATAAMLLEGNYKMEYLDYDWSLNEA